MMRFSFIKSFYVFLVLCVATGSYAANAQTYDAPQRIELDVDEGKYPYHPRPMGKNGLALLSKSYTKETGTWTVIHYDTAFNQLLKKDISLGIPLVLSAINSDENNFYALLQSATSGKPDVVNTYIINYNVVSRKIDVFSFYCPDKAVINTVCLWGDVFAFSTYSSRAEEHIYLFNTKSLTVEQLYTQKTTPCEFQEACPDTVSNSLWLITKFFESKRQTLFRLTQVDSKGKVIRERDIIANENYYLNSCRMTRIDSSRLLLIGDYLSISKDGGFSTRNNNTGIFTVSIQNSEIQNMLFFEYGLLEGAIGTTNKKNTSDLYNNTYLVTQNDSMIIVVSDFYTPEYVHEVYPDNRSVNTGIWIGTPYLATEAKLVGFRYHTAYFFIFDTFGKLLWYNAFNYNGFMLKRIKELMQAYIEPQTNNTLYYFGFDGKLYSLINNKNDVLQPLSIENIEPLSRFLSVNANMTYQCEHWYDNHFIYYGYQRLYNRYSAGGNSRKNSRYVFYANKLVYK